MEINAFQKQKISINNTNANKEQLLIFSVIN